MRILIFLLLYISHIHAVDFGVRGNVFPIEEEPFQEMMQRRLLRANLEKHNKILEEKMFKKLFKPESVVHIPRAKEYREFIFNPSFVTSDDIKDKEGNIIFKKESKVNPLDFDDFDRELWFIDGLDEEQIIWYRQKAKKIDKKVRLVLVGGSPVKLRDSLKTELYFDQFGHLSKHFGIKHVPAILYQKKGDKYLTIMEIDIG